VVREEQGALEFAALRGELEIVKSYTLPAAGHALGYRVTVRNLGGSPQKLDPVFGVADRAVASDSRYGPQTTLSAGVDGDLESWDSKAVEKKERGAAGTVDWLAFGERYFMVGLEPRQPVAGEVRMSSAGPAGGRLQAALRLPAVELPAGQSLSWDFSVWAGPRELEGLRAAGLRLRDSVDFGFFGALALPILWFLKFLHGLLGSWGGAIILLTVTVKALLFPLSQKSFKSMKDMQKLQPQIKELQEKYKDDREQLNREMMALWQKHGVNPMGGCMPIVVQMPIWFALYQVLWQSVELYQSPFLYFCDLSLRDPLGVFPTALGASMILQQRMTPTTGMDPAQQQVMKWMPVFFSLLMFTLPAGLVVYILVNNILSIAQQWVIQRQHGGPVAAAPGASAAAGAKKGS
jgi:YidC/Oxa1 family membrane protein insertase